MRYPTTKLVWILTCLVAVAGAGCRRDEIRVYSVGKEVPHTHAAAGGSTAEPTPTAAPQVQWKVPAGWQELPANSIRVGNFAIRANNQSAEVSVIPLPGSSGTEIDNVNRWRGQIGLPAIAKEQLASEKINVGGIPGKFYDLRGQGEKSILAAAVEREGTTWFFKMTGDASLVSEQQSNFNQFLKSVRFGSPAGTADSAAAPAKPVSTNEKKVPEPEAGAPAWDVPPGWKVQPTSPMVLAKFAVEGDGGKADVAISSFPGAVGGTLANVNRWRGQLGLPPANEEELGKLTTSVDVIGGKAILVDMIGVDAKTGQKARMVAAIVARGENTWFYKLLGSEPIVGQQKEAFLKFVQTVRYPK
jgi:hypothetical protein